MRVMLTNPEQIDQVFAEVMGEPLTHALTPRQAQIQAQVDDWIENGPRIMCAKKLAETRKVPKKCHVATGWRQQVDR